MLSPEKKIQVPQTTASKIDPGVVLWPNVNRNMNWISPQKTFPEVLGGRQIFLLGGLDFYLAGFFEAKERQRFHSDWLLICSFFFQIRLLQPGYITPWISISNIRFIQSHSPSWVLLPYQNKLQWFWLKGNCFFHPKIHSPRWYIHPPP